MPLIIHKMGFLLNIKTFRHNTAQKMKFFVKDFFIKCD